MSDEPSPTPERPSLEIDLALSFRPDWAKDTGGSAEKIARLAKQHEGADSGEERSRGRRDDRRGPRPDRDRDRRPPRGPGGPRGQGGQGGKRGDRRDDRRDNRRPDRGERPAPAPTLTGWEPTFRPEPRGIEGLAKQIRTTSKAYPLFDLAQLVLEKSERYLVDLKRTSESAPALFQLQSDGSVWLSEREAVQHVLAEQLDAYYGRETITVEPPKGVYSFVAICGLSDTLLGPPNYHDYQDKLRKLHAEKFADMPFEAYKSRIRIVRDEESIQKWKDQQSSKDVFFPKDTPEGEEPLKLNSLAEVESHFRKTHAATALVLVGDKVEIPGPAGLNSSSPALRFLLRRAIDQLRLFPLPMAHPLGQELVAKGLQIFKAHENITYVSIARPRHLDRVVTPISEALSNILAYLESHANVPRAEQWKALLEQRPAPAEGAPDDREATLAKDLSWLLHEGHVIDFARRGLEVARKPKPQKQAPAEPKKPEVKQPEPKPAEADPTESAEPAA